MDKSQIYHYTKFSDFKPDELYSCARKEIKAGYYGIVATADIKQGDLVMKCHPVTWLDLSSKEFDLNDWLSLLLTDIFKDDKSRLGDNGVFSSRYEWFNSLYPRKISDLKDYSSVKQDQISGVTDWQILANFKVQLNAFGLEKNCALYGAPSYINHSCVQNTFDMVNPESLEIRVFAIKNIKCGQEIVKDYVSKDNREEQKEALSRIYKIACPCLLCTSKDGLIWLKYYTEQKIALEATKQTIRNRPETCFHCFSSGKVKSCGRCKKINYCSKACQKIHWVIHKETCCK